MTLDQFRYFLAAARFQHVAKAAQSVAISPSAVSTAIAALESQFGCELFYRQGKSIILNEQGKYLRDELQNLLDHLSVIEKKLHGAKLAVQGSYRLAASHFLSARYLARAWIELSRAHPKLEGELCSMNTAQAVAEVLQGTLDFALCISPYRHPELKQEVLYEGQLRLAVRKGHPLLRRASPLRHLTEYPATIHKAAAGVEVCEVHPMFEKFGIEPEIRVLFDSDDQAVESLLHTNSWSLLPDLVIRAWAPKLSALPMPKGWAAPYNVAAVLRAHRGENQTMKLFTEKIRERLHDGRA